MSDLSGKNIVIAGGSGFLGIVRPIGATQRPLNAAVRAFGDAV